MGYFCEFYDESYTYLGGNLLVVVSRPDGQNDIRHTYDDHGDVERGVGEEVGVAEHEVPVDGVGSDGEASREGRQMVGVAHRVFLGAQLVHLQAGEEESEDGVRGGSHFRIEVLLVFSPQ
jgi:hypothetical protein